MTMAVSKRKRVLKLILPVVVVLVFSAPLPAADAVKIMPLGDSITKGLGTTPYNGYRKPLYLNLTSSGYNVDFVGGETHGDFADPDHEGHAGWHAEEDGTVYDINDQVYGWLVAAHPEIVLLHIGTNDITWGDGDANEVNDILDVIDEYEADSNESVTVILALIINRKNYSPATTEFNSDVNDMAQSRIAAGDDIIIVDMEHALSYPDDMADSVHPNDSGYAKMAEVWYNALVDCLIAQRTLTISSASGGDVTDPGEGSFDYDHNTDVNLVATADLGYYFVNWTGTAVDAGRVADPNSTTTVVTMDADYTVVANFAINQSTIFGYITEPDANVHVEGVFVDANNGGGSDITDANGYYELIVDYNWSGTVDPNKTGYTFEPNGIEYNNVTTDQNDNYTAILDTFIISGYAVDSGMLAPLEGVLVSPDNDGGPYTSKYYGGGHATTDANGYYEVLVDYNWSGNAVPSKYAYAFEPNSITYADVTEDEAEEQDYVGTRLMYTITGYIKNSCEVPIEGVLVDANNGGTSNITDANGYYEVWIDSNWSGTVTPGKTHYTFDPSSRAYTDVLEDKTGQDYEANNIYDLDCDGSVDLSDLKAMCGNWLGSGPGDFDNNGTVALDDFAEFAAAW